MGRKTNMEVQEAFNNHEPAKGNNLKTDGNELVSYSTIVAKHFDDITIVSLNKYTRTTSTKHLNRINFDYELPLVTNLYNRTNLHYVISHVEECRVKGKRARKPFMKKYWFEQMQHYSVLLTKMKQELTWKEIGHGHQQLHRYGRDDNSVQGS